MREMKDSGVEWIGEIPIEWQSRKLFGLLSSVGSGTTPKGDEYYSANGFPWLNTGDLNDGYISETSKFVTEDALRDCSALQIHKAGAVVIAMYGATIGKLGITELDVTTNQACCVMKPSKDLEKKYLFYLLSAAKDYFIYSSYGAGQPNISQNTIKQLKIPYTCIQEQKRIANYLDSKCAKVDSIIEKQQQIIEKLKEYKLSVITEAVTKGLNPDVEMKDSGVEWIGFVPKHWSVGKVKNGTCKVGSGKTPKGGAEVYVSSGVLFLRSQNVYDEGLVLDDPTYITQAVDEEMNNTRVYPGDVLLNITGGSIGRCCIFPVEAVRANVNQHVSIIRVLNHVFTPEYMRYYWNSEKGKIAIDYYQTGGNREGMSAEAVCNTPIPIPSISEQKDISYYIDKIVLKINCSVDKRKSIIAKLQDYKKSIIYEVVTGKKEV